MMKRLVLMALLLYAATLVFPQLGEAVQLRAVELWEWTGDRLEGPVSPITNRYRRIQAENHLSRTSRALVLLRNQGRPPPAPQDLARFMARNDGPPDGLDPWGMPYQIVLEPDSVAIMSAGPDRTMGTEHDLVVKLRFPSADRNRGRFRY
jgi:hypothetical protein